MPIAQFVLTTFFKKVQILYFTYFDHVRPNKSRVGDFLGKEEALQYM